VSNFKLPNHALVEYDGMVIGDRVRAKPPSLHARHGGLGTIRYFFALFGDWSEMWAAVRFDNRPNPADQSEGYGISVADLELVYRAEDPT
jgi:hypothetical protein